MPDHETNVEATAPTEGDLSVEEYEQRVTRGLPPSYNLPRRPVPVYLESETGEVVRRESVVSDCSTVIPEEEVVLPASDAHTEGHRGA